MKGKTGEICQKTGEYKSVKYPKEVYSMRKGKKFPPCGKHDDGTTWKLVRPKK